MKRLTIIVILGALMAGASVLAQPPGHCMEMDGLNLTDDQHEKIDDLMFQHQKEMIKKNALLQEAKLEFRKIMRSVEVNGKAALDKQKKVSSIKAEIAEARLKHKLAIRKILNKEQIKQMLKSKKEGCEKRGPGRRGMMKPPHGMMDEDDCMKPYGGPGMGWQ